MLSFGPSQKVHLALPLENRNQTAGEKSKCGVLLQGIQFPQPRFLHLSHPRTKVPTGDAVRAQRTGSQYP